MSQLTKNETGVSILRQQLALLGRHPEPTQFSEEVKQAYLGGLGYYIKSLKEGKLPTVKSNDLEAYNSPSLGRIMAVSQEARPFAMAFLTELCSVWAKLFSASQGQALQASMAAQALVAGKLLNRISPAGLMLTMVHRFNKTGPFVEAETGYFSADGIADCVKQYISWQTALDQKAQEEKAKQKRIQEAIEAEDFKHTEEFKACMENLAKTIANLERENEEGGSHE